MISAHSKDNGSPTSVAHKLDQTDSVVVRRDDLVVVDNAALGTLCEDVQIASRRNAGVLEVEWFRNGAELTLFQTFANRAAAAAQHEETWTGLGFSARLVHFATYADAAAQQRSYMRWMETDQAAVDEAIRVTGMYTYGRVELEPRGAPPPPGWTELMLAMHHQEPVGRCFQR